MQLQATSLIFLLAFAALAVTAMDITGATDGELAVTIRADYGNQTPAHSCYRDYVIERLNFQKYFGIDQYATLAQLQEKIAQTNGSIESPRKYDGGTECCTDCLDGGFCDTQCADLPPAETAPTTLHECKTSCPAFPLKAELEVPGKLNYTFKQPVDSCGVTIQLRQDCGNGDASIVACANGTCKFECDYKAETDCAEGVCAIGLSACGPTTCKDFDKRANKWANCTSATCDAATPDAWEYCAGFDMRITTTPAGCSYRNPDCGANEFCKDNTCVVRECNSSRQCGNGTGCNAFSCSDYKCVNYVQPGCEHGDKCYNYGNRPTIGNLTYYCGIDRKLSPLKKNETACTDAFECESNFCLEGTCKEKPTLTSIADGITEFLRGIIRWAQSLFETGEQSTGAQGNESAANK